MEHQRQLHGEERGLWELERKELHVRIQELEDMVHRLGGQPKSTFNLASNPFSPSAASGRTSSAPAASMTYPPLARSTSTGNEFWRGAGGKIDAQPTRSFSGASDRSQSLSTQSLASTNHHLPSISEDPIARRKSVEFVGIEPMVASPPVQDFHTHPIPSHPYNSSHGLSSIPGDRISASLDGISFKSSSTVAKVLTSNSSSPSPLGTPASNATFVHPSAHPKPVLLDLPNSHLTPEQLLKKDAGHTPLAKLAETSSNPSSHGTPTLKLPEKELPPLEPAPSRLRQPLERSDSYFPVSEDITEAATDGTSDAIIDADPALQEPLGLQGDVGSKENNHFLSQLDSKLLQAQRSNSLDTASETGSADTEELRRIRSADDRPAELGAQNGEDRRGKGLENEEPEPKLRMKRSTNFGSVFGVGTLGNF